MKPNARPFFRPRSLFYIFAIFIGVYGLARFVRQSDREDWGIETGSRSQSESSAFGFYVGSYTPSKKYITLKDFSIIAIPDAWVERCWKPRLNLLLNETRNATSGYNLNIPFCLNEIVNAQGSYKITLKFNESFLKYSQYPGIGFDPENSEIGFTTYLDSLPEILIFSVVQKRANSWSDVLVVDTIQFNRKF